VIVGVDWSQLEREPYPFSGEKLLRVSAERNERTRALRKLRLIEFVPHRPEFDEAAFARMTDAGAKACRTSPMQRRGCANNAEERIRNGLFLDTSYLITLADPGRERHGIAKRYYQEFLARKMPLAVSAIVAEFCVRQKLETLPLQQLILVPFNHEDAVIAAGLDYKRFQSAGIERQSLKDDFKILGHAQARGFGCVITDDAETMFPYCLALRADSQVNLRAIKLQSGFSEKPFAPDGQSDFIQVMEQPGNYVIES
jgi:hypothetical protein